MRYYEVLFTASILLIGVYAIIWRKRYSIYFTLIFMLVPLALRGYILQGSAESLNQAIAGLKLSYTCSSFLILLIMFAIFDLCNLRSKKQVRIALFLISVIMCIPPLTIGSGTLFYKEISMKIVDGMPVISKIYGPLHTVHYVFLLSYLTASIVAIIYSLMSKTDVSKKNLMILLFCEFFSLILFFGTKVFKTKIDLTPLAFLLCEIILLPIINRISLYDITENAIDTIAKNGGNGFISFGKHFTYLASNSLAKEIFPALKEIWTDSNASKNASLDSELISKIRDFAADNSKNYFFKEAGEKIYQVNIDFLHDGKKKRGYMIYIQDDTQDRKYISLLNDFNEKLKEEVAQKTEHIVKMHDNLILGMAAMVESRDNSTGGHIKRTSTVVKMLIDEIVKDDSDDALKLSPEFCKNLIKAAPMHDLGKIAVDDAILRKPGKFTKEEFEKMKIHAAEGAKIVHEVLKDTDDLAFHLLAENVAHYHHERWDGSGYPEGLKGKEIPLEARIMAVADVYDALVSKRVYKDAMSFEKADSIMTESFGKHFDGQLEKYYRAARPRLEEYYLSQGI